MNKIKEIVIDDDGNIRMFRWWPIEIEQCGEKGIKPVNRIECPIDDGEVFCVSKDGKTECSGFLDLTPDEFHVKCVMHEE